MSLEIIEKIKDRKAIIGVIGLGYVGLPLALAFSSRRFKVIGFEIDKSKIALINEGKSYINHIDKQQLKQFSSVGLLTATNDFSKVKDCDSIIICVPTPLNQYREPDLSFIRNTMEQIKPFLRKNQLISLESTTYPGTTEEEIKPLIEETNLIVGDDVFLIYAPEREDPGNKEFSLESITKVLGGTTKSCLEVGLELYGSIIKNIYPVSNTKTAEMTKLLENIHRAVNIGLMNELKPLLDKMDIDIYEVIEAASSKPFGFVPYFPGPGLGGHCIPIDPFYLTWKARKYGMSTKFIELAGEINTAMPEYVLYKIFKSMNSLGKSIKNTNILVLGISYKKNVDDLRESPSLEIIKLLKEEGAIVAYSDPYFSKIPKLRKYDFNMTNTFLNADKISQFDLVVLATDHDSFDYSMILDKSNLIVDTRGRFKTGSKVIRA